MKDLIVKNNWRIRTNERKQTFEIETKLLNFKWWDLYGRGRATRKIINKTSKGKPSR